MCLYQGQSLKAKLGSQCSSLTFPVYCVTLIRSLHLPVLPQHPLTAFGGPFKTLSVSEQKAPLFTFLFTCNLRIRQCRKGAVDNVFLSLEKNRDNNISVEKQTGVTYPKEVLLLLNKLANAFGMIFFSLLILIALETFKTLKIRSANSYPSLLFN